MVGVALTIPDTFFSVSCDLGSWHGTLLTFLVSSIWSRGVGWGAVLVLPFLTLLSALCDQRGWLVVPLPTPSPSPASHDLRSEVLSVISLQEY